MSVNPSSAIEALRRTDTPTIANAIERLRVRPKTEGYFGSEIRCFFPEMGAMVGYAVTAIVDTSRPYAKGESRRSTLLGAVKSAKKPAITVLRDLSERKHRGAVWRDLLAAAAKRLGGIGLVVGTNIRVELSGVEIRSGEIIHGDENGLVLMPPGVVDRLLDAIVAEKEREDRIASLIDSPKCATEQIINELS